MLSSRGGTGCPGRPWGAAMRIALGLEYCGTDFHGWQSQKEGSTVQDALEGALACIADGPVATLCAGRTDTGVHATQQVVHFDTAAERPLSAWVRGVNTHLPDSVAVRWAQPVSEDFHARFSARGRRYSYLLLNRPQRPGLWRGRTGWFHGPLSLEAMRAGAAHLLGEHDFSAFRAAECQARSPVKTLWRAEVRQSGSGSSSISPPAPSFTTWCAISSAAWSISERRPGTGVDGRVADPAGPQAGSTDLFSRRPLFSWASLRSPLGTAESDDDFLPGVSP